MTTQARPLPVTDGLEVSDAKEHLRQVLRRHRREHHRHPATGHDAACEAVTDHALQAVQGLGSVAAYVSVSHEPCTRLLLECLHEEGVRVLLPVLGPQLSRSWGYYRGEDDLAERAPGRPPEPSGEVLPAEEVHRVQALIVPALAVDRGGRRLGQGGGWYDRMLPLRAEGAQIFAMVHPDELVAGPLPVEEHDVAVDAVLTSESWFLLEGSAFSSGA
ncbi:MULTISPECIES: 5-formyltetrahydrofolate cyclo-ligase [unclassified Actinomyces]|uniref:5-formyltetrahydrofolate cyclo-ligase n=1 Tax=unclassified Actinomyces TaxID=2609248 RepID=UPI002018233B|nr:MULTISPECIES: 5-formyltetrahydrofolate cyclo-ligase [unclassified Actinomyces]MCL3778737.1 5-formyltetrahydrofolate cyclo-ligase [Actinomyces sp. AC-20-1]MCL3789817.1 5-formyltetrahydrofolate cyclo-ligase [Actinomyces sp. 187325]MCL3792439.1 5-formyltetrahydrofolate cyclo-ligase [Actinomyces sp. 186855]MCL3794695.1 5-formyltetrahydrofolate cyclo-ligase [Actinomyces sp. 217892]